MKVHITQIDGKLPNLACMKLLAWNRAQGHQVHFTRGSHRDLFEPADYDFMSFIFVCFAGVHYDVKTVGIKRPAASFPAPGSNQ